MSKLKTLQEELDELHLVWVMFYRATWVYKACVWVLNKFSRKD